MADQGYSSFSYRLQSRGVVARYVADALPQGSFSNLNNLESRAENAIASRLGLAALSTDGTDNFPLGGPVYSLGRMKGLDQPFRYAAAAGALNRRTGDSSGAFTQIANTLSGQRLSMYPYRPDGNASPYMFIADNNVLLKDSGSGIAQSWGAQRPLVPPKIQVGDPLKVVIENFDEGGTSSFTQVNITSGAVSPAINRFRFQTHQVINAGLTQVPVPTAAVTGYSRTSGIATIAFIGFIGADVGVKIAIAKMPDVSFNVAAAIIKTAVTGGSATTITFANPGPNVSLVTLPVDPNSPTASIIPNIEPGMLLSFFDSLNTYTIYVVDVKPTYFTANFSQQFPSGGIFKALMFQGTIAANTTGTLTKSTPLNLGTFGTEPSEDDDFIQLAIQVANPSALREIKIMFDVGDGSFTQDFYWKSVLPSGLQPAIANNLTSQQTQTGRVFQRAAGSVSIQGKQLLPTDLPDLTQLQSLELKPGNNAWTTCKIRLGDFVPVGLAGSATNNWANIVAWRLQVSTSPNVGTIFGLASMAMIGNSGLDSSQGQAYDYRFTYFNLNTGFETNPSVTLQESYWVNVQRQPIAVTYLDPRDEQFTHVRIYRRGGTLTQAWYRVAEVPVAFPGAPHVYEDSMKDSIAELRNQLQIDNDPPVTSLLRRPLNLTNVALQGVYTILSVGVISFGVASVQLEDDTVIIPVGSTINIVGNSFEFINGPQTVTSSSPGFARFSVFAASGSGIGGYIPFGVAGSVDGGSMVNVTPAAGQDVTSVFVGQAVTVGTGDNQETAYVDRVDSDNNFFTVFLQNEHANGETVSATNRPQRPMNLMAVAFDKSWLAGDPDNPHVLYYSKPFRLESFPPQNFIEVGTPDSPIMFMVATKGLLYVFTTKTVYQVLGAGSTVPIVIPTGVMHGAVSNFGWVASEGVIYYLSYDGVYAFQGSSSPYLSAATEWVWTGKNLGPVPAIDTTQKAEVFMAYCDHEAYISYLDQLGQRHRQVYSDVYARWRSDDQSASDITAQFFEQDTGKLIVGKADGMVYVDRVNDYDSAGFIAGVEIVNPINIALQTPQMDMGTLKAFKQYNNLTLDWDTNGQAVALSLLFDSGATVVPLGTFTQTGRGQTQININNGLGQRSLNVALLVTGSVTKVVNINEISIGALVEAEFRRSADSFWMKFGTDESKLCKQGYFEYQSTQPITYSVFIEGSSTARYTFTLPSTNGVRLAKRVRFPAVKAKLWRFVGTSTEDFQIYNESCVEVKGIRGEKGYMPQKLDPVAAA